VAARKGRVPSLVFAFASMNLGRECPALRDFDAVTKLESFVTYCGFIASATQYAAVSKGEIRVCNSLDFRKVGREDVGCSTSPSRCPGYRFQNPILGQVWTLDPNHYAYTVVDLPACENRAERGTNS